MLCVLCFVQKKKKKKKKKRSFFCSPTTTFIFLVLFPSSVCYTPHGKQTKGNGHSTQVSRQETRESKEKTGFEFSFSSLLRERGVSAPVLSQLRSAPPFFFYFS